MKSQAAPTTNATDPKSLVRALYEVVWNGRSVEETRRFFTEDIVLHAGVGGNDLRGLAAYVEFAKNYLGAVPDYHIDVQDILHEGDRVAFRWTCTGTHKGVLFAVPATGKRFTLTGMTIYRVRDGKFAEGWAERDLQSWRTQVGA